MSLQTGQILNTRYRIDKLLGQGGFGAVYRAWDTNLDGAVALKESLETTPAAQKQFQLEARILFQLRHPNLPRVSDYFTIPGQGDYLVMDYIEGKDLGARLLELGRLPVEEVIRSISQVCDALAYLHAQNPPVIHRDIKPTNIRIAPDGQAILVDFGIAKLFSEGSATLTGARAITPGYSPPEQYGIGATDARSDVYALGATVYHLLTGKQPPASVDVLSGSLPPPPPLIKANPALSPELSAVVEKAMRPNRADRLGSVAEFKQMLMAAYPGAVLAAGAPPAGLPRDIPTAQVPAEPAAAVQPPAGAPPVQAAKTPSLWRRRIPKIAAGLAALCLLAVVCSVANNLINGTGPVRETATAQALLTGAAAGASGPQTSATWDLGMLSMPSATPAENSATPAAGVITQTVPVEQPTSLPPASATRLVELHSWDNPEKPFLVALWPNNETLAAVSTNKIQLLRIADNARMLTIQNPSGAGMQSAVFSPDHGVIACGFADGKIRLWEYRNNVLLATLSGHSQGVTGLAFYINGSFLASSSADGSAIMWKTEGILTGKRPSQVNKVQISSAAVNALVIAANAEGVITGSADGSLHTWLPLRSQLQTTSEGQGAAILSLVLDANEKQLAISNANGQVYLWQSTTDKTISLEGNSGAVRSLVFSPDGKLLAGGDAKGRVIVWQTADGKVVAMLEGHSAAVISVAFSSDGLQIVSAAEDGSVKLWGTK